MKHIITKYSLILIILTLNSNCFGSGRSTPLDEAAIIERLDRSVRVLETFNNKHRKICRDCFNSIELTLTHCQDKQPFASPLICSMMKAMHAQHCIESLFETWKMFKRLKSDDNLPFLKEFAQIVLVIYHELIPAIHT